MTTKRGNQKRGQKNTQRRKPARGRSPLRFLLYWSSVFAVWGVIGIIGVLVWYAYDLPDVDKLRKLDRQPSVTLVATDGSTIAAFGDLYGEALPLSEMPPVLLEAVVATEDRRFYNHYGVDPFGLARATVANVRAGRVVQGGSTITQQLAKNVFLTQDRTIKRKAQEVLLSFWLEHNFTKQQILQLYLNRVYLGAGTYGVEAASRRYFGKSARELTLAEAAMIAGLLKAPSRYAPTRDLTAARDRAAVVLASMVDAGYIDKTTMQAARAKPASLDSRALPSQGARYFADWLLDRVPDFLGHADRDLIVVTTLDAGLQRRAERAVETALARDGGTVAASQAALLVMDHDGAVRAMVGGRNYQQSQFNRATQARRQPGSAFKPVVYLAGLEAGLNPESTFDDIPVTVDGWSPRNYSGKHEGAVSMRYALARSINTVAVRVSEWAGRGNVINAAFRLGITSEIPAHPSIALGTAEVSLLDLTAAYGTFANGGLGTLPHAIVEIRDRSGRVLYQRKGAGAGRVISAQHAGQMTDMLRAVMHGGTGKLARLERPSAGKTGTSQDFRDAWFVGYTGQMVVGVWVGNDDGRPMKRVTGGGLPAKLWHDFMIGAHQGLPAAPLLDASRIADAGRVDGNFIERLIRKLSSGEIAPAAGGNVRPANSGGGGGSDSSYDRDGGS